MYSASYNAYLITVAAFVIPAVSISHVDTMYYAGILLLSISWIQLYAYSSAPDLDNREKTMVFFWLLYCGATFIDLYFRVGWDWPEFQEPSRFLLLLPAFLLIRRVGFNVAALRWGVVLGALSAGCWGYYQKLYLGIPRVWGGTPNLINAFGVIGLILGILSVSLMQPLWRQRWYWGLVTLVSLGMGLLAAYASGTKGGWIALPLLFWVLVDLLERPTITKRFIVMVVVLSAALLIYWWSPFVQSRVDGVIPSIYNYFAHGEIYDGSAGIRLGLWHGAVLIFLDNPLWGAGVGTFKEQLAHYYQLGLLPKTPALLTHTPHSQFFEAIAERGIIGPIMVFGIYLTFIMHCRYHLVTNKPLAITGILLAFGFIDFGLVDIIWDVNMAGVFFTTMMMLVAGQLSYEAHQQSLVKANRDAAQSQLGI